jgi:hypothetical protein
MQRAEMDHRRFIEEQLVEAERVRQEEAVREYAEEQARLAAEIEAERQRFDMSEQLRLEAEAEQQRIVQEAEQQRLEAKRQRQLEADQLRKQQEIEAERLRSEAAEKQQALMLLQEQRNRAFELRQQLFQKQTQAAIVIQTQVAFYSVCHFYCIQFDRLECFLQRRSCFVSEKIVWLLLQGFFFSVSVNMKYFYYLDFNLSKYLFDIIFNRYF